MSMVHSAWSRAIDQYHSLLALLTKPFSVNRYKSSYAQSHSSDLVSLLDDERLLISV